MDRLCGFLEAGGAMAEVGLLPFARIAVQVS